MTRTVWRFRVAAVCLLLTTAAFLQEPGQIAADTKLDLTQNPWGFLSRAITLWNDQGFFGQLQNQAYGYLWPMGPFFAVGHSLHIEPWVLQRLWWALLLCLAFLGMLRVTRLMGVVSPVGRLVGALAFALSARIMTTLGPTSVEAWPMALAPWLLIPLIRGSLAGSARRWAALSALALVCVGGVNAVATAAIIPIGVFWLATRQRGERRRSLSRWWVLGIALASVWWTLPLLLLGRYSPPFLDWIESASVTTRPNEPGTILRGTTQWVAYIADTTGPEWPAGWQLVSTGVLVFACSVMAVAGLIGLSSRALPERGFVMWCLASGLVLVSLGHVGATTGFGAPWFQSLLDGPLSPIRNVHKFEPLVAFALAVGVAHTVGLLSERTVIRRPSTGLMRWLLPWVAIAAVGLALLGTAWPLVSGSITRGRTFASLPGYWSEAANWLGEQPGNGVALVAPSSSFGIFLWGRTQDEPLQPLAQGRWAARDAVPLSSVGNIRVLDAINEELVTGHGSAAITTALQRSGVRWLVVPNDRDVRPAGGAARSVLVRQALEQSPGITPAATFGPLLVPFGFSGTVIDGGVDAALPAIQIYKVAAPAGVTDSRVVLRPTQSLLRADAQADSVLALSEAGLLGQRALVLSGVPSAGLSPTSVIVDAPTRTEVDFGLPVENRSNVLSAADEYRRARRVHDFLPRGQEPAVVALPEGVIASASSSQAWPGTPLALDRGSAPFAAVDLDSQTAWLPQTDELDGSAWWRADFASPIDPGGMTVRVMADPVTGQRPSEITVTTSRGSAVSAIDQSGISVPVATPPGTTSWVQVSMGPVPGQHTGRRVGLAEVSIPRLLAGRPLVVPAGSAQGGIVLRAAPGAMAPCVTLPLKFVCSPALSRPGEEQAGIDRVVTVDSAARYNVFVHLRARYGSALNDVLAPSEPGVVATASSVAVDSPSSRAQAATDGDGSTVWSAASGDAHPSLTLRLPEKRVINGAYFDVPIDSAVSRPLVVDVTMKPGQAPVRSYVSLDGSLQLPSTMTDQVRFDFVTSSPIRSVDTRRGTQEVLPLGVAEVVLRGGADLNVSVPRERVVSMPCGVGPVLEIDGALAAGTRISATQASLLTQGPVTALGCGGPVALSAGEHRIRVRSTPGFTVEQLDLRPTGMSSDVAVVSPTVVSWTPTDRTVTVPSANEDRLLELAENANVGWTATVDGRELVAVTVDGWRQAWSIPAGVGGEVRLAFAPMKLFGAGLVAGLVAVLLLVGLCAWPARRKDQPALSPAQSAAWVGGIALALAVAVVGGWLGLLAVVSAAAMVWSRNSARWARVVIVAAPVLLGAGDYFFPWPASQNVPGVVAAGAGLGWLVAVALVALLPLAGWGRHLTANAPFKLQNGPLDEVPRN